MPERETLVDAPPPPIDNGLGVVEKPVVQEEPEQEETHEPVVEQVQEEQEVDDPPFVPPAFTPLDLPTPPEDEYDQAALLRYELDLRESRQEALDTILNDIRKMGIPEDVIFDYKKNLKGASAQDLVAFYNRGGHRNDAYAYLYLQSQQKPKAKVSKPAPVAPKPTGSTVAPAPETESSKLTKAQRADIDNMARILGVDPKEFEADYLRRAK